jgi:hypothetical protein
LQVFFVKNLPPLKKRRGRKVGMVGATHHGKGSRYRAGEKDESGKKESCALRPGCIGKRGRKEEVKTK